MTTRTQAFSINWWEAEPRRFERDQAEVGARFPDLRWRSEGAGRWEGELPLWPFERPRPDGLAEVLRGKGLQVVVACRQGYPMVPPRIYPCDPEPEPVECTQHRWHVNGDRSLCLAQTETAWNPADSICDLIEKAAGWRVEYALMKIGAIEAMSLRGMVTDPTHDALITEFSRRNGVDDPSPPEVPGR